MTFDIERMQKSIDSGTVSLLRGMTHSERKAWVREELRKIDLVAEDSFHCWEEQDYSENGRYEDMLTDSQLKGLQ